LFLPAIGTTVASNPQEMTMSSRASDTTLAILRSVDTPTVCNAIEEVLGRRMGLGYSRSPVVCANPLLPPIVGYARTAKIGGAEPSKLSKQAQRDLRIAYYRYAASGSGPNVVVLEDTDSPPGLGAFWGEVNTAIHQGLGVMGCLTNGSFRDIDMLAPGFQIVGGSIMPSHAFVHVREIDVPVSVFGLNIEPGDLIHADRHGAVVIGADSVDKIAHGIDVTTRKEAPILKAARSPGFNVEALIKAWGEADDIH
jgi:regulator of RNase E activity RraA